MAGVGKLRTESHGDGVQRVAMWCPGCAIYHGVPIDGPSAWTFNGDYQAPTFSPSLLVSWGHLQPERRCHSFIVNGQWQFLADCSHQLAGQTVPMRDETD